MSITEEEGIVLAPWIGPTSYMKCFSIAVLSTNVNFIENITSALIEVHARGDRRWKMILLRARSLEQIVRETRNTGKVSIDFVVLALDTSRVGCIDWAKRILREVHPDLRRRRVILVNASGLPANSMSINPEELLSLQDEYNLDLLSANVNKPEDTNLLGKRLLKHLDVTIGTNTGIPNLNI